LNSSNTFYLENLYDFEIYIKESTIPNSGLGAFLKMKGIRSLPLAKQKRNSHILATRAFRDKEFRKKGTNMRHTLEYVTPSGWKGNISLKGEGIDWLGNREYVPQTMVPLQASMLGKTVRVNLCGEYLHFDPEEERLDIYAPRIGFGGLCHEFEYTSSHLRAFRPNFGSLNIGAYGPFRSKDRKNDNDFALKDFLFCHVPSEWAMDARNIESHQDKASTAKHFNIDITSDVSGSPHEVHTYKGMQRQCTPHSLYFRLLAGTLLCM
jgi:hypothetical protein